MEKCIHGVIGGKCFHKCDVFYQEVIIPVLTDVYIDSLKAHAFEVNEYCDVCERMTIDEIAQFAYNRTVEIVRQLRKMGAIPPG